MNQVRYCLPVIENCTHKVLQRINEDNSAFACVEIWIDYIQDLSLDFFEVIAPSSSIIVSRRLNNEHTVMALSDRILLLNELVARRFTVDLDLMSQRTEIENLSTRSRKLNLLLSYHNFQETPSGPKLEEVLRSMNDFTPYIRKIATFCKSEDDAERLLDLLLRHRDSGKVTIQGMGEHGVPVRVFGSIMGNFLTYAPKTRENASAPGQLTQSEFAKIFQAIADGR